MNIMNLVIDYV